jgi:hypothetical protein
LPSLDSDTRPPITVITAEGWTGVRLLRSISPPAGGTGKLPYLEYLRLMARHQRSSN